jgi:hypothetical protein
MYELAKSARNKMKAKAERLAGSSNSQTPFYPQGENASDKVGMRPISESCYKSGGKASGGKSAARADRIKRKSGGRTKGKGKTNINIVIAAPGADAGAMPPGAMPPRGAPAPGMAPAPATGMAGMPPMPPGGGMPPMGPPPGGMPPMGPPPMRKAGGRVGSYKSLKAGSGSGLGRLKKSGIGSISK